MKARPPVITETFTANHPDKELVAEFCLRLGYSPAAVGELHITSVKGRMVVSVTRLNDGPRRV